MIRWSEEVRKPTFSNHPTEVKMEKRELAEKIVLAMLQSGILVVPGVTCTSTPSKDSTLQDMQDRAKRIKAMIDAVEKVL